MNPPSVLQFISQQGQLLLSSVEVEAEALAHFALGN